MTTKKEYERIYKIGWDNAKRDVLDFIEYERDNGNIENLNGEKGRKGFSASLCLSKLMKKLKEEINK
jgi:hypothetical protein